MTSTGDNDPLVTVTDIAREVGVGASAVSNWRKRHADFPAPAETSDGGNEMFRLSEINAWLRSTRRDEINLDFSDSLWQLVHRGGGGRFGDEVSLTGLLGALVLRQRLHAAGSVVDLRAELADRADPHGALTELLERAGLSQHDHAFRALESVATEAPEIVGAVESIDPSRTNVAVEAFLARWVDAGGLRTSGATTTPSIARLVARLAPPADTVLDPAIGTGGAIIALLEHNVAEGGPALRVLGQDINDFACSVAVLRLLAHGLDTFEVRRGDSLHDDAFPDVVVDLVLADPPYNQRAWGADRLIDDPRWRFAMPTDRDANAAWIQHVLYHLAPGGHAIVVVPPGILFGGGRPADFRRSLVAAGIVEGVISLPAGMTAVGGMELAVLLLRSSASAASTGPVLFINASSDDSLAPRTMHRRGLNSATIDRIASAVADFRDRRNGFAGQPGFATAVPINALLADASVALNSQQWVEPPISEAEDFAVDLTAGYDGIARILVDVRSIGDVPALTVREPEESPRTLQIRDIALTDAVEVLRPGRLDKGDYTTAGTPVLTQTALNRDGSRPNYDRYVDLDSLASRQVITQPGDVILATVGRHPYAVVDRWGGAVLGNGLELLRIHADWLDPDVVAACLSSSQTARAVTGTTIPRVRLRDLTLPAMTAETTATVRDNLERLRQVETAAQHLAHATADARRLLVEAVVAGNDLSEESQS